MLVQLQQGEQMPAGFTNPAGGAGGSHMPGSSSGGKFNPEDLGISTIHAILWKCKNDGVCDDGPKYMGTGSVPSKLSTSDMLAV